MPQDARIVEFDPKSLIQLLDTVHKSMVQYFKGPVGEISFSSAAAVAAAPPKVDYTFTPADFEIRAGDTVVVKNDHTGPVVVDFHDPTVFGLVKLTLPDKCSTLLTVTTTAQGGQLFWDYSDDAGGGTQPITVRPPQN